MKKGLLFCCVFVFVSLSSVAQNYPFSGSTWIFQAGFSPWIDEYLEKWEYTGDSAAVDGIYKKLTVTTKTHWSGMETIETDVYTNMFLKCSGDSVSVVGPDYEDFVADFDVTVGDSMLTPYHNHFNLQLMQNGGCDAVDSNLVLQKGVVTEIGVTISDNISSDYYKLRFLSEYGDSVSAYFNKRMIIMQAYWGWYALNLCSGVTDGTTLDLICHYDDSTADVCSEDYWFEHLETAEKLLEDLRFYPNPANNELNIVNPSQEMLRTELLDLNGRKLNEWSIGPSVGTITLPEIGSGIYLLRFELPDGRSVRRQLVKQ